MTTITRSGLFVGRKAYWKEPRVGSSLCVTDFLSTRDRRLAEPDENVNQHDLELEFRLTAAQRRHSAQLLDPVEHFVYSLISAAALVALLMGFLCMADFARRGGGESSAQASQVLTGAGSQSLEGQFEQPGARPN
jgi:hypothetical protein